MGSSRLDWLRRQVANNPNAGPGGPMPLFGVAVFVLIGAVAAVAALLGFGLGAVLTVLAALFMLMAAFGGPLRADLRLLAWLGKLFVLVMCGTYLLATISPWLAAPVTVVIVFVAALLPALGPRFATVSSSLGAGALLGFALPSPGPLPIGSLFGSVAVGVAAVMLWRLLLGLRDPSKATRKALATTLRDADPGALDTAWRLWRSDRPYRWMAEVLAGAGGYRVAHRIIATRIDQLPAAVSRPVADRLADAERRAADLAERVEQRAAKDLDPVEVAEPELPAELRPPFRALRVALDRVAAANARRGPELLDLSTLFDEPLAENSRAVFSWRSSTFRHALRCAIGMLVAVVIAALIWGDPLVVIFLITTFSIMQPSLRDTVGKAVQRLAGSVLGVAMVGLLALVLPPNLLLPVALVAVFAAFGFLQKNMTVFFALIVVMTVLLNIATRHLPPDTVLPEYLALMVLAAVISLVFGFAVVPGVPTPEPVEVVREAMTAVRSLANTVARRAEVAELREVRDRHVLAARAVRNLLELPARLPTRLRAENIIRVGNALDGMRSDLAALTFHRDALPDVLDELEAADRLLDLDTPPDVDGTPATVGSTDTTETELLRESLISNALAARRAAEPLLAPAPQPSR